jgi:hypothetical protein
MLCSVVFLNLVVPNSESGHLNTLSDDVTEKELKFKSGGSDEGSVAIELNKKATVISSKISIEGAAYNGEYPKNIEVDVGSDGDNEWQFIGEGYGRLGQQTTFTNDKEYQSVKFKTGGYNKDTHFLVPKNAIITKANLTIQGFFGGEGYIATIDYYGDIRYSQINPDGTFGSLQMVDNLANTYYSGCGIADFDDDGDFDLIALHGAAGYNFKNVYYYEKTGSGPSFAPKRLVGQIYGYYPEDLAIGDFNNDNYMDFMGTGLYEPKARIYFGDGNGFFRMYETTDFNMYYSFGISQGDLDKDSDVDIVIVGRPSTSSSYTTWWFENLGNGYNFLPHDTGYTTSYNGGCVVGDYDNDGNLDILTGDSSGIWYFSKGHGTSKSFDSPVSTGINGGSSYTGWGDSYNFNSDVDTYLDLVSGSSASNGYISAYLGNSDYTFKPKIDIGDAGYYTMGMATPKFGDIGHVTNPTLDIGDDNTVDWSKTGEFKTSDELDITTTLTSLLANPPSHIVKNMVKDDYGNEFYSIPLNFTSTTSGYLGLEVGVLYDYKATINKKPGGNLTTELNEQIKNLDPSSSPYVINLTIPVKISTETAGKLKIQDIDILYNMPPEPIKPILTIKIQEDTIEDKLLNLKNYFDDPDLPLDKLTFTIDSNSEEDNIDVHTDYDQWLQVGPKNKHWYGRAEVVIRATDKYGEYALSNEFIIKSEPVEDNPDINEDRDLPDITIYEGGTDDSIDLDEMDYFYDPEGDPLYFVAETDPKGEYDGEEISVSISSKNELVVKGLNDWFGSNVPVWIYCDDDQDVKTIEDGNYVHQEILVHVLPVNDPPVWKEIPEIKIEEDAYESEFKDVLNLSEYALDIDNDPEDLTYYIQYNSNDEIGVDLKSNNSIDIIVDPDYFGTTSIGVRVYDNETFADTVFKINILPVNDPPSITIDSHKDYDVVEGLTTINGTALDVENELQYIRLRIDNGNWHYLSSDFNNWRFKWDTTKWSNDVYLITAEVFDGEYFDYTTVYLTVSATTNLRPTVDITLPEDGSNVKDTITVSGTAADPDPDGEVTLVEVRIDNAGSWLTCVGTDSWEYNLDTSKISDGEHSLVARSFDGLSYSELDSITINVRPKEDSNGDDDEISALFEEEGGFSIMTILLIIIIIVIILVVFAYVISKTKEQQRAQAELRSLKDAEEAEMREAEAEALKAKEEGIDYTKFKFATPLALPAFTEPDEESESTDQ